MNSVQLVGRLTRDPEIRQTQQGMAHARFTLACDRKIKREGEKSADFISCVAFGKTAEFIEKYFKKGMRMGLQGRIQTASYTNQQGNTIYTTDVITENVEFVESKKQQETDGDGFMDIPEEMDKKLPFS